jgi:hypothetical protein
MEKQITETLTVNGVTIALNIAISAEVQSEPVDPTPRAYGMTREEYLTGANGTPIDAPVMKNHDQKHLQTGMDFIHGIRYFSRGVSQGRQITFGLKPDGTPAHATLGANPDYQDFGVLFALSHSPNTARWGSVTGGVTYPHLDNLWRFKAVRPVRVYFVAPPGNASIPTHYQGWSPSSDLNVLVGETPRTCRVVYKDFPAGDVQLPSLETGNVATYRTNVTGILSATS